MSQYGSGLLLVMMEPEPAFEEKLNRWYTEEHFAERLSVPGFLGGRRFVAVTGQPKYLALYDLASPEVLQSEPYLALSEPPSPWTAEVRKHVAITRNVYRDITPHLPPGFVPRRRPAGEL
ncbi:DUF4286 family protein [Micromonospora sp. WMMD1082]|uniref:DUF4286 family protein n=1 Tax=Micromonospora sp. WMMD1082 TaxID=3016104 RepID=UPI002417F4CD|nr:DUF4286 family protein [Micromonospora sp. WMMD1082]MDG4798367.1 hypothetical protein [Micromonospora sp. WMMD1082]